MNNTTKMVLQLFYKDNQERPVIRIYTLTPLGPSITNELTQVTELDSDNSIYPFLYEVEAGPYNSFALACLYLSRKKIIELAEADFEKLKEFASGICRPKAFVQNGTHIGIHVPDLYSYTRLMRILTARHNRMTLWTVPFSQLYKAWGILYNFKHPYLPSLKLESDLVDLVNSKITDDLTMTGLFNVKLEDLLSVKYGWKINPAGFPKLKYNQASDLLLRRPVRYTDRKSVLSYREAPFGESFYMKGEIVSISSGFNDQLSIILNDGEQEIALLFFGIGYLSRVYNSGDIIYVECKKIGRGKAQGVAILSEEEVNALPIAPIYRQSAKNNINTRVLTGCVQELLTRFDGSQLGSYIDCLDTSVWDNLANLHFPKDVKSYQKTLDNLAFVELFYLQMLFLDKRANLRKSAGLKKKTKEPTSMKNAISKLPYELTKGQKEAIKEIIKKLNTDEAENVLLSGDTGSGKSTVAQAACLYNYDCGYQSVLVGPTEILARQLYDTFVNLIKDLDNKPTIAYLSGNTKAAEKREIERNLRNGEIDILVGTHGVFNVEYKNLGLIVIDEQQKFGTEQREKLLYSRKDGRVPDLIAQTATPIPRSTALAFYGDIDLITLSEKPGNRKENITKWVKQSPNSFLEDVLGETWQHIFQEIKDGHQVFIVTPAVEESERSTSVKEVSKILERGLKDIKIDVVHGQMKKEQQNKVITKFRNQEFQVLIASSIIEVGMDIPNATIMLVLDADRFGASSLHQIRGRVGRSELQGYCYLVSDKTSESVERRLGSLERSNDGFEIALVDLETRKEGDLFGVRQSGEGSLLFCDLAKHTNLIDKAKEMAEKVYNSDKKEVAVQDAYIFLKQEAE